MNPLSITEFADLLKANQVEILDVRPCQDCISEGFIPGAICIGLHKRFAEHVCLLFAKNTPLAIVATPGQETEAIEILTGLGYASIAGYLQGGMHAWKLACMDIDLVIDIEADELAMDLPHDDKLLMLDVRNQSEFAEGHVVAAENIPLSYFADAAHVALLPEEANLYLYSHQVNRSLTAATMLKKNGLHHVRIIHGGWLAIKEQSGIPTEKEPGILN